MKDEIISNLKNPRTLEQLYRKNKTEFKTNFILIYNEIRDLPVAEVWYERLNYDQKEQSQSSRADVVFVLLISFIAGLLAKVPDFTPITEDFYFPRNISIIVLPLLIAYFLRRHKPSRNICLFVTVAVSFAVLYINIFPDRGMSDAFLLACIHLPLFMWALFGLAYTGNNWKNLEQRLQFLRFNGDLIVMTTIILIAGALLTGITIGLFSLIDMHISDFYFNYVVIWGLAAAPLVAAHLVSVNPGLVHRVSPLIARIFTPLVLVTLILYLFAVLSSGKDPYNDREFLLLFNLLLIGVMAIIFFSIAESTESGLSGITSKILLLSLSMVSSILNAIALSAIFFRIAEWGITPNRVAVAGANTLFLIHLIIISLTLRGVIKNKENTQKVGRTIASFLPVYVLWAAVVTFLFPILF